MRNEKLTDSEIAELRAAKTERDRWKWLLNMLRRVALWTVALVAGLHTLIDKGDELLKLLQQKP
jgi:hypothetical protein